MKLSLENKLKTINQPKVVPYSKDTAKTVEEFWDKFVAPHLPKTPKEIETYIKWYELLSRYCKDDEAVFAIRAFSTPCGGAKNYITLRRGFFTKTNHKYSFFYTDNYFAAYFLKMAKDGFVPDYEEFKECILSRKFPARFGPFDSKYEKKKAAYIINGKDPGFTVNGYKIAHIIDTGMNYDIGSKRFGLAEICEKYFPRDNYENWKLESDKYGDYYVRTLPNVDVEARDVLRAHFLRFACPLNYVLTPKKSCHICHKTRIIDIAEYPAFQQYAQEQFHKLFGSVYQKYLDELDIYEHTTLSDVGKSKINIEYDIMMAGTDELSEYARFIVDICEKNHRTASSYKSSVRSVMKEMNITDVDGLEKRIDEAIDYCTNEISVANKNNNKEKKKDYSNYRSALRKYKVYLTEKSFS